MNTFQNFRAALAAAGLNYAGEFVADGKIHRFRAAADKEKNSWYVLHTDLHARGTFGCWKRGVQKTWCEKSSEEMTDAEQLKMREALKRAEKECDRAELERQAKAQKTAAWILNRARTARTLRRYLTKKGVQCYGGLYEFRGALVLPLRDAADELFSLQFIDAAGKKRFLSGGKIAGCSFTLADKPDDALVICEGYATGASIHEAMGLAVICAMNCHNLAAVANVIRKKYPQRQIIIAADNDQFTDQNPGMTKAAEAARTIRARLVVPQFKDIATKPTDFNDLHKLEGIGAVKLQLEIAATPEGRPRLVLPGSDRPDSVFTAECGRIIGAQKVWFLKGGLVVEVRRKTFTAKIHHLAFHVLRPVEVCTAIEDFIEIGTLVKEKFVPCSMSDRRANVLINSPQFKRELPEITRVLDYKIPVVHEGQLIFPEAGFDARFGIYTNPDAPAIIPMEQRTALMWLHELLKDFCFDGEQSLTHAIARLLTPMCRQIMRWDARGPFWIFTANRERLGKDYLAVIAGLLFDGYPNEDAPLESRDSAETKKRITSAIMSGRNRMHFANCSGHICDAALEQAITAKCWSDRVLGGNTEISLPNEIEFSMSGNNGIVTYRGDLAHRARHIRLSFAAENPNGRTFTKPDLHRWVQQHRPELLSALASLIRHWFLAGKPAGITSFASFPEWAATVGGVMLANGLDDPCLPEALTQAGGDEEFRDMKALFRLAHDKFKLMRVDQKKIAALIVDGETMLFSWINFDNREGQTRFGKALRRYDGRVLDSIVLKIHTDTTRPKFSFEPHQEGSKPGANPTAQLLRVAGPTPSADIADIADVLPPKCILENPNIGVGVAEPVQNRLQNVCDVREVSSPNAPRLITDPAELTRIADTIAGCTTPVALDIETYGKDALNPYRGDIRLLTLSIPDCAPWILDLKALGYDLVALKPALESALIVGHNLKFDLLWLKVKCGLHIQQVFCTMTAARLLHAGTKQKSDLGAVIERYLDINLAKDQARSNWGLDQLTPEQIKYASDDVSHLHQLKTVLASELEDAELTAIAQLEMNLLPVVVDMEATGFAVDRSRLETLLAAAEQDAEIAKSESKLAFNNSDLNLNSPAQLLKALAGIGVEAADSKAETLAAIEHPTVKVLLCYRVATKQAQMLRKLNESVETDGRIHARFKPMGTATGRFSSSDPNLQNVGRGEPRSCFIARPGCVLVVADYSQIELRAAAALADEPRMLDAYQRGADLHLQTAELVLGRPATKADRQLAKAVNFGLLYGQYPEGLARYAKHSYGVEMSVDEATTIRRNFFEGYEGLQNWHRRTLDRASGDAYQSRTRLGRRRLLEDAGDSRWKRFATLINTPVQGSCADGMKHAMVKLARLLPDDARLVSSVHDELIVETPAASADAVKQLVTETMISEMQAIFPEVPITVDSNICADWGGK